MQNLDRVDVVIVDEFDAFIMNQPYEFKNNSPLQFSGIWNLTDFRVIGMSATASDNMLQLIEDVITGMDNACALEFKSEYELLTGKSLMNLSYVMLGKEADVAGTMIEKCTTLYKEKPIVCFLEQWQQD